MAYVHLSLLLFFFLFLHFHSSSVSMVAETVPLEVEKVCRKTQDYIFCIGAFTSDPRSVSTDIKGLTLISFQLSSKSANETKDYISQLLGQRISTREREGLLRCGFEYDNAISSIDTTLNDFAVGSYQEISLLALSAYAGARTCKRGFIEGPMGKSPLTSYNEKVMKLYDISTVVPSGVLFYPL